MISRFDRFEAHSPIASHPRRERFLFVLLFCAHDAAICVSILNERGSTSTVDCSRFTIRSDERERKNGRSRNGMPENAKP